MICIKVNDNIHQFSNAITVKDLIDELKIYTNGIGIALNHSIVKKENWESCCLQDNDTILIVRATQGG